MRIHHTALEVRNLEESLSFYTGLLGFSLEESLILNEEGILLLQHEGYRLELTEGGSLSGDSFHICFQVESISVAMEELCCKGIHPAEGPVRYGNGWVSFFIKGPSGEWIEFLETEEAPKVSSI